jgi:hypothetical protein
MDAKTEKRYAKPQRRKEKTDEPQMDAEPVAP